MKRAILTVAALLVWVNVASAHVPDIAATTPREYPMNDPAVRSVAIYGHLTEGAVHTYAFTASTDGSVPVEVIVPRRPSLEHFRPSVAVISPDVVDRGVYPESIPAGLHAYVIPAPQGERPALYEEYGMENYYDGTEEPITLVRGTRYVIAVFEPNGVPGDYALAVGTAENFSGVNFGALIGVVAKTKLGAVAGKEIPWLDLLGAFLFIAGFVVGLGAVTVIDIHGFLGRKSGYWTEATTRTHKVTKPLIWAGTALAAVGGLVTYRGNGLSGTAFFHLILLVMLVLNGLFLTFKVSPFLLARERQGKAAELLPARMQRLIAVSFVVSFLGWWTSAFLFAWHVIVLR